MHISSIVKVGDSVLRKKAEKVEHVDPNVLCLLNSMADTMYENEGIGLAAPQVGVSKRIIIVDVGEGLIELVNPEVISESPVTEEQFEGCLSVPGIQGEVERPVKITLRGLDRDGKTITFEAHELLARVLQHEIDHLDGILFIDKVSRFAD